MSTPSSSIVGKWKSSGGCEFTYENIFWHETPRFRFFQVLLWPLGSRKYGLCFRGFGTRSGKLSTKGAWAHIWKIRSEKNEHETVARARRQKKTKPGGIEATPDLCEVRSAGAASRLVDLVRPSCYSGLQPGVIKWIGTAARRKASVMQPLSCYAGLQQEIASIC